MSGSLGILSDPRSAPCVTSNMPQCHALLLGNSHAGKLQMRVLCCAKQDRQHAAVYCCIVKSRMA